MMAVVDARNGKVHSPPLSGTGTGLYVPMDPMSGRNIDSHRNSTLMTLRNACKTGRTECGVYYFNFQHGQCKLIQRDLVDLTKQ